MRGNSSEACLQAVTRWNWPQIQTLADARPSSVRAAAAIPTYGKSILVMIVVWHIKDEAASEGIMGRSKQPTVFARRARSKRRWAPPCVFRLECNDVTVAVESPHEQKRYKRRLQVTEIG